MAFFRSEKESTFLKDNYAQVIEVIKQIIKDNPFKMEVRNHEYRLENVLDSRDGLGAGVRIEIFFGLNSTTATYGFYEKDYQNIEEFREHMTEVFKVTTCNDKVRLT